jgi:hypothetical protein
VDTYRYGRTMRRVHSGSVDVNAELVRRGAAWVYLRWNRDPLLRLLEDDARRPGAVCGPCWGPSACRLRSGAPRLVGTRSADHHGICLYGAFQSQADFTSPISYTVVREQLLVARRPTVIG